MCSHSHLDTKGHHAQGILYKWLPTAHGIISALEFFRPSSDILYHLWIALSLPSPKWAGTSLYFFLLLPGITFFYLTYWQNSPSYSKTPLRWLLATSGFFYQLLHLIKRNTLLHHYVVLSLFVYLSLLWGNQISGRSLCNYTPSPISLSKSLLTELEII